MKNLNGKNSQFQNQTAPTGEAQTRKRIKSDYEEYKKEIRNMNLNQKANLAVRCLKREIAAFVDTRYGKNSLNKHLCVIEKALNVIG